MKNLLLFILLLLLWQCHPEETPVTKPHNNSKGPVILIHGGAGQIYEGRYTAEEEAQYHQSLQHALDSGYAWLSRGENAETVVEKVIRRLESDSLFNAGIGAVYTAEGKVELDASIMRGSDLNAGAVSGVQHIEHPISLAHWVMDSSKHVMLSGRGAEHFGFMMGLDSVSNEIFHTVQSESNYRRIMKEKYGTVGCVVLDNHGNLAAGTSTGGMMMKEFGRIGDSPIIGAGTYADNQGCAVSCTGHGEYFIRYAVAHHISQTVSDGVSIRDASSEIIHQTLKNAGGEGGVIAVDTAGNYTFQFNTQGMFRGVRNADTTYTLMYEE
ncbi:MAG: isoaspartyl peptidase/L-asparaginase [Bacteroidetes bacterium]|nr:MAG: isoaspartyl peptidase/L-asparaginase [Bacteroidota bacterium]